MKKASWFAALAPAVLLAVPFQLAAAEPAKGQAQADTAKSKTDEEWLNTVWTQVDGMVKQEELKLQETVTVAGVRGAEAEDQVLDKLYYKGSKRYPSQDKLHKAVETLKASVARNPKAESVPQQRFYIAQCYEKLGQLKDAKEFYTQLAQEHAKTAWGPKAEKRLKELAAAK
jgi:tetratricopeptide (TPR) repeat protein